MSSSGCHQANDNINVIIQSDDDINVIVQPEEKPMLSSSQLVKPMLSSSKMIMLNVKHNDFNSLMMTQDAKDEVIIVPLDTLLLITSLLLKF
jgi:hypothetical protein